MRCSSCEPLLDQYLDRVLSPRVAARVARHLETCAQCAALLHELRSVDGLLLGATQPELPPNFTFALMAEVRSRPVAPRRRVPAWIVLVSYLAAAWIAVAAALAALAGRWPEQVPARWPALAPAFASLSHLAIWRAAGNTLHAIAPATPLVAAGVSLVLCLDLALFVALFFFYRSVRPQLAAHLAPTERP
jgi:anti-sigma factor RsiW